MGNIALAALIALVILSGACASGSDDLRYSACDVTKTFVNQRLASPGSAKYQRCPDVDVKTSGDDWTLQGYVDSQNAFGALLRSSYVINITHVSGTRWKLNNLELK